MACGWSWSFEVKTSCAHLLRLPVFSASFMRCRDSAEFTESVCVLCIEFQRENKGTKLHIFNLWRSNIKTFGNRLNFRKPHTSPCSLHTYNACLLWFYHNSWCVCVCVWISWWVYIRCCFDPNKHWSGINPLNLIDTHPVTNRLNRPAIHRITFVAKWTQTSGISILCFDVACEWGP